MTQMNITYPNHYVVVVDKPIATLEEMGLSDCNNIHHTSERFLPKILVKLKIFPSVSQVRKNRPDLWLDLKKPDWLTFKIGERMVDVVVGVRDCEFPGCKRPAVEEVDCGPDESGNERIFWFCERHRHTAARTNEREFALGVLQEIRERAGDRVPTSWLDGLEEIVKENLRGVLFWQRCPACGHVSTPDCEGHTCHQCGKAKYVEDQPYFDGLVKRFVEGLKSFRNGDETVEELPSSERGTGGFGSTGV